MLLKSPSFVNLSYFNYKDLSPINQQSPMEISRKGYTCMDTKQPISPGSSHNRCHSKRTCIPIAIFSVLTIGRAKLSIQCNFPSTKSSELKHGTKLLKVWA